MLLLLQYLCIMLWWGMVSVVLLVKVFDKDRIVTKIVHALLGFVAAGGVVSWFGQHTVIIERMETEEEVQRQQQQQQQHQQSMQPSSFAKTLESSTSSDHDGNSRTKNNCSNAKDSMSNNPASGYNSNYAVARAALHAMPEAYRSASTYASVVNFDEGLDGDYDKDHKGPESEGGGGEHHRYFLLNPYQGLSSNRP